MSDEYILYIEREGKQGARYDIASSSRRMKRRFEPLNEQRYSEFFSRKRVKTDQAFP